MRVADRASPCGYGAGLLAMVVVGDGVLLVRPAANANRYNSDLSILCITASAAKQSPAILGDCLGLGFDT
jgi:hypothetical protein